MIRSGLSLMMFLIWGQRLRLYELCADDLGWPRDLCPANYWPRRKSREVPGFEPPAHDPKVFLRSLRALIVRKLAARCSRRNHPLHSGLREFLHKGHCAGFSRTAIPGRENRFPAANNHRNPCNRTMRLWRRVRRLALVGDLVEARRNCGTGLLPNLLTRALAQT